MRETLEAREVDVEFLETAEETVYVGYQTHLTDATRLFTELQATVTTILDGKPGAAITGAAFHTQHPVIATWHVEADWAEGYDDGTLSPTVLMTKVLGGLETVSFQ